jgi:protein-tyrosine phosphatase
MIDFHNHLIPGVDDGARDLEEALRAVAAFQDQGVATIVCTPHLRVSEVPKAAAAGGFLERCDAAWEALRAAAGDRYPGIALHRGAEVMLDIPDCDLSDARVRLAGTRFVLVEFPLLMVPPHAGQVLFQLVLAGWLPVIAHPERYSNADENVADAAEWKRVGAYLQVNAGSLLGKYGERAAAVAWRLVRRGMADFVSSDYHARGTLHLAAARAALERHGAAEQAQLLTVTNPARLLADEEPLPVPPVARKPSLRERLGAVFRR